MSIFSGELQRPGPIELVGAGVVAGEAPDSWVDVLKMLDEKIGQAKVSLARGCTGPRPKGVGALSQLQLRSEVLDWQLDSNRRKIACLAGDGAQRMEYRAKRTAGLLLPKWECRAYPGANHCGDGLADGLISAPVSTGPKMAGSLARQQSGPEEKKRWWPSVTSQ